MQLPPHFRLLYSADAIAARVEQLAGDISNWLELSFRSTGHDVLGIPLLRGGIFFFADLVRRCSHSVALSPCRASAYHGEQPAESVSVTLEEELIGGRSVLLIDEVCDSGRTLDVLSKRCLELGALEVRQAVLIKREIKNSFEPSWVGFRYSGEEWLVGYGMDEKERYRNLPAVYIIDSK